MIQISARGDGGTLFGGGAQNRDATDNLPTLVMAAEHYNRIVRLIEHEIPVKLQFEIKTSVEEGGSVQRDRGDSGQRQEGRTRDGGRPLR